MFCSVKVILKLVLTHFLPIIIIGVNTKVIQTRNLGLMLYHFMDKLGSTTIKKGVDNTKINVEGEKHQIPHKLKCTGSTNFAATKYYFLPPPN